MAAGAGSAVSRLSSKGNAMDKYYEWWAAIAWERGILDVRDSRQAILDNPPVPAMSLDSRVHPADWIPTPGRVYLMPVSPAIVTEFFVRGGPICGFIPVRIGDLVRLVDGSVDMARERQGCCTDDDAEVDGAMEVHGLDRERVL